MTRRHLMTLRLLLILGDAVAASLVFILVSVVRFELIRGQSGRWGSACDRRRSSLPSRGWLCRGSWASIGCVCGGA